MSLLKTFDGVCGVADDVGQRLPDVVVLVLAFDHVSGQLGSSVVARRLPGQRAVVGEDVFDGEVGRRRRFVEDDDGEVARVLSELVLGCDGVLARVAANRRWNVKCRLLLGGFLLYLCSSGTR